MFCICYFETLEVSRGSAALHLRGYITVFVEVKGTCVTKRNLVGKLCIGISSVSSKLGTFWLPERK